MERNQEAADNDPTDVQRIGRILAEIEAADFDRVDPPADLWDGIMASLASDGSDRSRPPKEPPRRLAGTATVVEYRIDADDFLIEVGRDWSEFARANGAPGLAASAPNRSLWTYFDRDEVRELWQLLVDRIRATRKEVKVPLRCDAPDARRWFEMTVTPEANAGVRFRCLLVFEESRPPVALLDRRSPRNPDAEPLLICSWCGRGKSGSSWLDVDDLVHVDRLLEQTAPPPILHGICSPCRNDMSAELLLTSAVDVDD